MSGTAGPTSGTAGPWIATASIGARPGVVMAECLIGISTDEATRMKDSRVPWIRNRYPLIEEGLSRAACESVCRDAGFSPKKSSCVYCPYHSDAFWAELRENHPLEWASAVKVDHAIRDQTKMGLARPIYLHRSLTPLDEVRLRPKPEQQTLDMFENDCTGSCGV